MGDVSVDRGATAKIGQVEGDLRVGQAARIEPEDKVIHVTGRVSCDGDAEFHGSLSCSEFSARHGKIRIVGDLVAKSDVRVDDGGMARVGGGKVSKGVGFGGTFESTKPLRFSKSDVGGLATLVEGGE